MFYPHHRPIDPLLFRTEQLQDLGLLFALLALGAVADLTREVISGEAEDLEKLAKCALGMTSFGSLSACQAMVMLGRYEVLTDRKENEEAGWALFACGCKIGLAVGFSPPIQTHLWAKLIIYQIGLRE